MQISSPRVLRFLCVLIGVFGLASAAVGQIPASSWVQLHPAHSPHKRGACAMAYDPVSKKIVMFGGYGRYQYFNDTWTFDGIDWKRQHTAVAPSARAAAGMAFDKVLQKLVLYGGWDGQNYQGDTWAWDGANSTWVQSAAARSPLPETGPMLFPDPRNGKVDNFGGFDGRFYSLTTWRWSNGSWRKLRPAGFPSARASAVFATDPVRKQTLMFGGLAAVNPNNTWTYDGRTWTQQSPSNQLSYRFYSGAVYDPRFQGIVAFGGFSGADVNDTWLWDGTDWQQLSPASSPAERESFGMAFDEVHQQTVIFGGLAGDTLQQDTWVLQTN